LGLHAGNNNNLTIEGAYQENFLTTLAFLPAADRRRRWDFSPGRTTSFLRSQLDFLPTVLELYGVSGSRYYGSSFAGDLVGQDLEAGRSRCLVSVQPFAGGSIAVLQHPFKHVYHLRSRTLKSYDLARDPEERYAIKDKIDAAKLKLLDQCLASIKNANAEVKHRPLKAGIQ
jgi:arylsulfatase A-like enzyme